MSHTIDIEAIYQPPPSTVILRAKPEMKLSLLAEHMTRNLNYPIRHVYLNGKELDMASKVGDHTPTNEEFSLTFSS